MKLAFFILFLLKTTYFIAQTKVQIIFVVEDKKTQAPIDSAKIMISFTTLFEVTTSNGVAIFNDIPVGEQFEFNVYKDGYSTQTRRHTVSNDFDSGNQIKVPLEQVPPDKSVLDIYLQNSDTSPLKFQPVQYIQNGSTINTITDIFGHFKVESDN